MRPTAGTSPHLRHCLPSVWSWGNTGRPLTCGGCPRRHPALGLGKWLVTVGSERSRDPPGCPARFPCSFLRVLSGWERPGLVSVQCSVRVRLSSVSLVKNRDPSPPLSLGRAQESLLTCDIDASHRTKAKRVLMHPGKSWFLHPGCGGLGSSNGRDTAWSHRATLLPLLVGCPEDPGRPGAGGSASPRWGGAGPTASALHVPARLTGGVSPSQTHPEWRPEPAPRACESWTGRQRVASANAPCAGGVCAPAVAVEPWPVPRAPSWSKCLHRGAPRLRWGPLKIVVISEGSQSRRLPSLCLAEAICLKQSCSVLSALTLGLCTWFSYVVSPYWREAR